MREGVLEKVRYQWGWVVEAAPLERGSRGGEGARTEALAAAERARGPRADLLPRQGWHWSGNPGRLAPAVRAVEDP